MSAPDNAATVQYVRCPHCHAVDEAAELLDAWDGKTYRCIRCGDRFHLGEADNWLAPRESEL